MNNQVGYTEAELQAWLASVRPVCPGIDWPAEIENPIFRYVYLGYSEKRGRWKIGVTSDLDQRARQLGIRIEHSIQLREEIAGLVETLFHRNFGYMDKPHGHEWYTLDEDSIREIKGIQTEKGVRGFCWVHGWRHVPKIGWVAVEMGTDYSRREILEIVRERRRFRRKYARRSKRKEML